MPELPWKPWISALTLRPEALKDDITLSLFAASLYDAVMDKGSVMYRDPAEFFGLTYTTNSLRDLARDVLQRLAGKNDRSVRQLALTYGGGKTHALLTLYHLVNDPAKLPRQSASVDRILSAAGMRTAEGPPRARVAILPFDQIDVEKGMEARSPSGAVRRFKLPWSLLAWQLGGEEAMAALGGPEDGERLSPPATNVLTEILGFPARNGLATLILIDEVILWARTMFGLDPEWGNRIQDFFQYLTQAAAGVDRCAIVASILANDPKSNDEKGRELARRLEEVFRRGSEQSVEPVAKEDVAQVLRRRFFTPDSTSDTEKFVARADEALVGVTKLNKTVESHRRAEEERYRKSYPFHPDLIEALYTRWYQLPMFQQARGVLRIFALALRDSYRRGDTAPIVSAGAFLGAAGQSALSEASRELVQIAQAQTIEESHGDWQRILQTEIEKAIRIQQEFPGLANREMEAAVLSVFLYSQPATMKALTQQIYALVGPTRPDPILLQRALARWIETSWFLDEGAAQDRDLAPDSNLPRSWRLGMAPNLRQMQDEAIANVGDDEVNTVLESQIRALKSLTDGVSAAGAMPHPLPASPRDISDDTTLHYVVLGPNAASSPGKPSATAKRFIEQTTGPDTPRTNQNGIILAVPSADGLETARHRIRELLAWQTVRDNLRIASPGWEDKAPARAARLTANLSEASKAVPSAIRQAYCIVVTLGRNNQVEAFKIDPGPQPLFSQIAGDPRSRIQQTAVSPDALLPGGPYDLWKEGEPEIRIQYVTTAFSRVARLPKMLSKDAIHDTLIEGCKQGFFVLRVPRPQGSSNTFWREEPTEIALAEHDARLVLPEQAALARLNARLLAPDALPNLWTGPELTMDALLSYFSGDRTFTTSMGDVIAIPRADRPEVIERAVEEAVGAGVLWLTAGQTSLWKEPVPEGILAEGVTLQGPPPPLPVAAIGPEGLPEFWKSETADARALTEALSTQADKPVPWLAVRLAIEGALAARILEIALGSGPLRCDYSQAHLIKLTLPKSQPASLPVGTDGEVAGPGGYVVPPRPFARVAEATLKLDEVQNLADKVGELKKTAVGRDLTFYFRLELDGADDPPEETIERLNRLLKEVSESLRFQ